jgi:short subunit dehydrogenase-like uncharacterized protein
MPTRSFILYGATGHTGSLIARRAVEQGLTPLLVARDALKLDRLARELGLDSLHAPLEHPFETALGSAAVMLNAAGPFSATAPVLQSRAVKAGVHYLDVSGETVTFELAARKHAAARANGVMLMPGVGFDVVVTDCLAVHVARELGVVERLSLAVFGLGPPSRGSARAMVEQAGRPTRVRRHGMLADIAPGSGERYFHVEGQSILAVPISWADVITAHFSTGASDITVYFEATPALRFAMAASRAAAAFGAASWAQELANANVMFMPEASDQVDAVNVLAEAFGPRGSRRARLWTPNVYAVTADAAVAVTKRVLSGDFETGFQTPGRLFGPDFVLSLAGVRRMDSWS